MLSHLSHPLFQKRLTPHVPKMAEGSTLAALAPAFAIALRTTNSVPTHTEEYGSFIKSQLASRDQL
jgi:hypothetical protein